METANDGPLTLRQPHFIHTLKELLDDADIADFQRARSSLAWTLHCRPEYACVANNAAQVTEEPLSKEHIRELNSAIRDAKGNPDRTLTYGKLEVKSLHMGVYVDA